MSEEIVCERRIRVVQFGCGESDSKVLREA